MRLSLASSSLQDTSQGNGSKKEMTLDQQFYERLKTGEIFDPVYKDMKQKNTINLSSSMSVDKLPSTILSKGK